MNTQIFFIDFFIEVAFIQGTVLENTFPGGNANPKALAFFAPDFRQRGWVSIPSPLNGNGMK